MEITLSSITMNKTKYFFILFLLYTYFSFGFQSQEKRPLLDVIRKLEVKFDVKFSYSMNDVDDIFVDDFDETKTLKSIIENLNNTTILNFKLLDDRYITVSTIDKTISVCGILIAEKDNQPLFGASVLIANTTKGVITDTNGKFQMTDVPLNEKVIISFLGFETLIFNAKDLWFKNNSCKTIVLQERNEELNQVLISKFLTTGLQKRIDGSTVLNTEKFGILPGLTEPDILQSIQALPGVESVNESIANINVRGGTNDQNLILWDGIKMYHFGHFFGLISAYNPYLTDKVLVIKNGTSSEFSDGVSSTISMFTKDKLNPNLSGGFGANLIHADAFLQIPLSKKWALHVSGRRSFTDVVSSPTYDNYFERSFQDSELTTNSDNISEGNRMSDFFFYDYTAKLIFNLNENHKFRANVIGINNNLDYTESYQDDNGEMDSKTSNLKQENLGFGMSWNAIWSDRFSTHFTSFYSQYNIDATDFRIETDQRLTQTNDVLETGLKFKTNYKINENLNFLNGYQFSEIGILNETTVSAPSYDKTKKDVLLNHALFSDFLGVENRRWVLANEDDIPISESKQISLGFEINQNNWLLDVEAFYKQVDGITASNQGFYNNFQFLNAIGSYNAKGVEFLLNRTANKYSTWLSYTYSTNDYGFESFTPSIFPNNVDIRHSVSLAFNYDILENLKVSVGGIWRSGQPYTKPVEGNETVQNGNNTSVNYDAPNSENLDDFMRLDASISYSFNLSKGIQSVFRVGVLNILDRENSINRYYEVNPKDSNSTIQIDNKSLGLTPNLSFRMKF